MHGEPPASERAETYLRLLAETALRLVRADPEAASRVHRAASTLHDAGVISAAQVAWVLFDLSVALRARGRPAPSWLGPHPGRLAGATPPRLPGALPDWRVVPAPSPVPGASFMTLILTADRALIPATLRFPPGGDAPGTPVPPWTGLSATDDAGTSYQLTFAGGTWAGSTWTGTIVVQPAPPASARTLQFDSPHGPLCLARLPPPSVAGGTAEEAAVPVRLSPGERLLIRHAEALLAALPAAGGRAAGGPERPGLGELVRTLEGAGALSPLSPVTGQVGGLYELLGRPAGHDSRASAGVPARWLDLVTHYGRRKHLPPVAGTAAIGGALPELDGARFAVAGVRSGAAGSFLHVIARGLRAMPRRPPPGRARDPGFSWWVLDNSGGWHLGTVDEANPMGADTMLRLALLPPLGHAATTLTIEVAGVSQQVTAALPARW